jgi:hypothetical protein
MAITERTALGYMRARIMARHSRRPGPEQWQQLENCRNLDAFLQIARQTSLNPWIQQFEAGEAPDSWERSLRQDWQAYLAQLLRWTPARWQDVLAWTGILPVLPAIAAILNQQAAPEWVRRDYFLLNMSTGDHEQFRMELAAGPWQRLLQYWQDRNPVAAWWEAWRDCWPKNERVLLQSLSPGIMLLSHSAGLPTAALERFLCHLLRDQHASILPVIGHLGLLAMDLRRLRSNLQQRQVRERLEELAA